MRFVKSLLLLFIFSIVIPHFSIIQAQETFGGDYMLVQYILEDYGYREVMHFELFADGDTSGTYKQLYSEQPDSGTFYYFVQEDRSFIIPEEDGIIYGIGDDQGDVFTFVRADSEFAMFAVGIRKSSGKTVADLSGDYWVSEFITEPDFQAAGLGYVTFDGSGYATLYRIENTIGDVDSVEFPYAVGDDGTVVFDNFLVGALSPDGQYLVAAGSEIEDNGSTYVMAVKKSSGLDNSVLSGNYIYNQVRTETGGFSEENVFYAGLNYDGEGSAEATMFLGEPLSETFSYEILNEGNIEIDSSLGAVSADGRYYFSIDMGDTTGVAFGMGIQSAGNPAGFGSDHVGSMPSSFTLEQNYPNPFNPRTTIEYTVRAYDHTPQHVNLSLYNLIGQKVATLISEKQSAGVYQVEWDATGFASGVYYYSLEAGEYKSVKKMVLVR
jgi:hypothetical protein